MYNIGAKNIEELQKKAGFVQIASAYIQESHTHDVFITNAGDNY